MAQTKKSTQDYWNASFGEQGQARPINNALEVGGRDSGGVFEPLPIGTSATGTAVLVDLIGAETVSVSVGTITNLGKGTITKVEGGTISNLVSGSVVVTAGTVSDMDTVGTVGVLEAGSVVITAGTISDMDTVGTVGVINDGTVKVGNLAAGTVTKIEGGTIGNLASGSVVVTSGTIGDLDTVGTVGVLNAGSVVVTAGTISDLDTIGTVGVVEAGTVTKVTNLAGGTITKVEGGTVGNLASGSVVVTAGTVTTQLAGTQQLLGTANYLGTVGTLTNYPLISGEDQTNDVMKTEHQFSYSHYTSGSGTVKSSAGFLHAVVVNNASTAPVEIFDAVGTAAGTVATLKASIAEQTYIYNVICNTGITIAGTSATVCDITVVYR